MRLGAKFAEAATSEAAHTAIQTQLHDRLLVLGVHDSLLSPPRSCMFRPERYRRTFSEEVSATPGSGNGTAIISFAICLHNSERIIHALMRALVEAIVFVRPHNRVYVSIFENGSTDKTAVMLGEVAAALLAAGVDGLWVTSSVLKTEHVDRIVGLAEIRNEALAPLLPYMGDGVFVFLNDVVLCASDIIELVHQQRLQEADLIVVSLS